LVKATGDGGHRGKRRRDNDVLMAVDSGCDINSDTVMNIILIWIDLLSWQGRMLFWRTGRIPHPVS